MPKREPTSAEYDHLLQENDALRLQLARLHSDLKRKQQTIAKGFLASLRNSLTLRKPLRSILVMNCHKL